MLCRIAKYYSISAEFTSKAICLIMPLDPEFLNFLHLKKVQIKYKGNTNEDDLGRQTRTHEAPCWPPRRALLHLSYIVLG